jgi:hypothetical protein
MLEYVKHLCLFVSLIYRRALRGIIYTMSAKKVKGERNSNRQNGKANKKHAKVFDPIKRRLVNA